MQIDLYNLNTVKIVLLNGDGLRGGVFMLSVDSIPDLVQSISTQIATNPLAEYINVYNSEVKDTLRIYVNDAYLGMRDLMEAYRNVIVKRDFNATAMKWLGTAAKNGSLVETVKALREYFNRNCPDAEIKLDVLRYFAESLIKIVNKK